jgi:hypothetical protein
MHADHRTPIMVGDHSPALTQMRANRPSVLTLPRERMVDYLISSVETTAHR